ncbi:MAG: hypothetical protein WB760_21400 [Xanthobacteraceae bacterium]
MKTQLFVLTIASLIYCFAQVYPPAMAQAGSTGGTVGKQDKSASGGNSPDSVPATRKQKPHQSVVNSQDDSSAKKANSSCGRIVGTWKWGAGFLVVIKRDGTAHHDFAGNGTWKCDDGQYVFVWSNGITDHISVSTDGDSIAGNNNIGMTFSGTRF